MQHNYWRYYGSQSAPAPCLPIAVHAPADPVRFWQALALSDGRPECPGARPRACGLGDARQVAGSMQYCAEMRVIRI